ncbi:MAG: dTDP-4-dehydrorhamnose reductase [Dongiaceae bacterium]
MSKIVVIGESGQLAQSLRRLDWPAGFDVLCHGRSSIGEDFRSDTIRALLQSEHAQLVLNAAAYTAVDRAESEPQAALALNAELPRVLAAACRELDIPLVHVSTDYVFDGEKQAPYLETDTPNPLGSYGRSKLAGDHNVERSGLSRWAILRTSWVVSEIGETFPVKLLRRARAGEPLRVVDDQTGCPTAASELARAMQVMGLRLLDRDEAATGLFNFCGASEMSWHGFAERLLRAAETFGISAPPLQAIASADLNAPARRPAYSVLSCRRILAACGVVGTAIEADVDRMVRTILAP